jgi:hypothetical protein
MTSGHVDLSLRRHALKLREVLQARLGTPAPPLDAILLMDRNTCERGTGSARSSGNSTAKAAVRSARCKAGRGVKHHAAIAAALDARFAPRRVIDFTGSEPYYEQARAFYGAAVVVGPHGAQLANMVFCQKRAAVIEFVAARRGNSALYAGYASSVFGLDYWTVVGNAADGSYDDITPADVVPVVELALDAAKQKTRPHIQHGTRTAADATVRRASDTTASVPPPSSAERARAAAGPGGAHLGAHPGKWQLLVGDEESNLVSGYGSYVEGWPAGWR